MLLPICLLRLSCLLTHRCFTRVSPHHRKIPQCCDWPMTPALVAFVKLHDGMVMRRRRPAHRYQYSFSVFKVCATYSCGSVFLPSRHVVSKVGCFVRIPKQIMQLVRIADLKVAKQHTVSGVIIQHSAGPRYQPASQPPRLG